MVHRPRLWSILFVFLAFAPAFALDSAEENTILLSGTWAFKLDLKNSGIQEKWYARALDDTIKLPGTTDESLKGIKIDEHHEDRLSRVYSWIGPAWYQRRVTIPDSWGDKRVILFLERTKNVRVWVDDKDRGSDDSLSAPQIYDLTGAMTPGSHLLTILVDNAKLPPVGPAHAVDERTQTNWNGIIGKIELRATDGLWLDEIRAYPDIAHKNVRLSVVIKNRTKWLGTADLKIRASSWNTPVPIEFGEDIQPVRIEGSPGPIEMVYDFDDGVPLWSEFNPAMIRLTVSLEMNVGTYRLSDSRTINFGMREFSTRRNQFTINGTPVFLRGKNDACIFPLTGYPPMDKAGWMRVMKIAKSYGINHYRFHSWCPPEAAFEAADELGIYIQAELPNKRDFGNPEHDDYLRREGERIFRAFGNHPSFVMLTLGNELGRNQVYFEMVDHFKKIDPRRLYAQGTNNENYPGSDLSLAPGDDFWVTSKTGVSLPVRGSFFQGDFAEPHIEHRSPSTMADFSESIAGIPVPVVGHETGQFQVFPDFTEIPEYAGVLRARNYEIFRDRLAARQMLDQANDFVRASGALAILCYREDIEAALRTPGFGGFQLLDLQDFPGQGTAPVGILNAFMESKGLIAPRAWREFCCETVPLLRMRKYTWTADETFTGRLQVAHYGARSLDDARMTWTVTDGKGQIIASDKLDSLTIEQGKVSEVGMFCFSLAGVEAPQRLSIGLVLEDTPFLNHYSIWVYPPDLGTSVPQGVRMTRALDSTTMSDLDKGGRVLFSPDLRKLKHSIKGSFQTDFWCFPMFRRAAEQRHIEVAPGTLGILCDPKAPALARFPTDFHSDWQWWFLVKNSRPVILDNTPPEYRPIVQVIDNFERNHKLGLIFEARVGRGRLLVCAIDLLDHRDKPEARQLLYSLLQYADSDKFRPQTEWPVKLLEEIFEEE
jgi:hypothetical protein